MELTLGVTPLHYCSGPGADIINARLETFERVDASGHQSDQLTLQLNVEGIEGEPQEDAVIDWFEGYEETGAVRIGAFKISRITPRLFPRRLTIVCTAAPFVVSTDKLRVRVLGTSFCMQAYEGSQQAEVVLEHGSVRLQTPAGVNLVTLQPDQRALYDAADDNLAITQVNASHLVLTQYDLVTMSDATLHEIISHIETTFGVRLSVPGRYGDKRYTFNYQRSNSLEEVLNIVEYLTGEHCEVIYRKK